MKAVLFALFVALLMVGCGESSQPSEGVDMTDPAPKKDAIETAVDLSKLEDRDGVKYLPNEKTPFTGKARKSKNGNPKEEASFKDGKYHGLYKQWWKSGQKWLEITFKDGKKDGLATQWYEHGQKLEEANWKEDKEEGLATKWYKNGQKKAERTYKNGKMDGLYTLWYENGQKAGEGNYKDGKLMSAVDWKLNGEKCPVTNVKDGNGVDVYYNRDGTEEYRFTYKDGERVKTNP